MRAPRARVPPATAAHNGNAAGPCRVRGRAAARSAQLRLYGQGEGTDHGDGQAGRRCRKQSACVALHIHHGHALWCRFACVVELHAHRRALNLTAQLRHVAARPSATTVKGGLCSPASNSASGCGTICSAKRGPSTMSTARSRAVAPVDTTRACSTQPLEARIRPSPPLFMRQWWGRKIGERTTCRRNPEAHLQTLQLLLPSRGHLYL